MGELGTVLVCSAADDRAGGPRLLEPIRCGIPWPRGRLWESNELCLVDPRGEAQPLQARVLDRWPDGSVRWVLLDWLADTREGARFRVGQAMTAAARKADGRPRVQVERDGSRVIVDTGRARFDLAGGGRFPFRDVRIDGRPALDAAGSGLTATEGTGSRLSAVLDDLEIVEGGPIRATLRLRGRLIAARGRRIAELAAVLHFFAGTATVRIDLTLRNPRAAGHPGGRWSLGQAGSVFLRDLSFELRLPAGSGDATISCSPEVGRPLSSLTGPLELYQDSSGGERWDSLVHVNRRAEVPNRFRGYRLSSGSADSSGLRATPVAVVERDEHHLTVAVRHFWQEFPKALEASSRGIRLRLFPQQYGDVHELQGGEQKTHSFFIGFARDRVTELPLDWCRSPLLAHPEPEWYATAEAVPYLRPRSEDPNAGYLSLVDAAIEGKDSFEHKREAIDEYGWRHFGDIWGDHEAVFHRGSHPLVSHYNNQYDAVSGFAIQFMRSGDARWYRMMDELARHVIDIDIYHTDVDKSAYNHGQFWHTVHYVDAGTSTHRTYPPVDGVAGGGPSTGNMYTTGLMLHHFLTGHAASRDTVLELGTYVIDADDGSKTVFRFLDRGHSGHVSGSGFDDYHGPGRSPANAINALVDAHRLSGEPRFLAKAEQLVRRCIHPRDDLQARNLADAESRWFYTMFLQNLAKYLDHKAERGEVDRMYAYGRDALLHYARWALKHEYPYLERPEILEFPTETWAAQDMRKSEVFKLASRHASGEERRRLLDKARFFFDHSVAELGSLPTRTLCRPVVLMLSHGFSQAVFDGAAVEPAPQPTESVDEIGEPLRFVPQKQRVKRKLRRLGAAALAALILLAAAAALVWGVGR